MVHVGKHGNLEWLPGKTVGMSALVRHRRGARRPAADLPVPGQRPGRGHPGQAPRARHAGRPPGPADGPGRELRRHRPARAAARRARQDRRDGPGQAAGDPGPDLDADPGRQARPRPRPGRPARTTPSSTSSSCTSTAGCARSRTSRSATACTSSARPRPARPGSTWCWRCCGPGRCGAVRSRRCPACARRWAWPRTPATAPTPTRSRRAARGAGRGDGGRAAGTAAAVDAVTAMLDGRRRRGRRVLRVRRHRGRAPAGPHHRRDRRTSCTPWTAATCRPARAARRCAGWSTCCRPAATSTPSTRKAVPVAAGLGDRPGDGRLAAGALPRRHRRLAALGRPVGLGHRRRCAPPATTSPRCSRCSACARSGTRPRGGSPALEPIAAGRAGPAPHRRHGADLAASSATRSRTWWPCSTTRCGWSPAWTSRTRTTTSGPTRAPTWPSTATSAGPPPRIFGSKPGAYGAGLLPLIDCRQLARRRRPGRGLRGLGRLRLRPRAWTACRPAPDMEAAYRRIAVAAKNIDTREHDIADSDDYFQYHGGMIATVRALTGTAPRGLHRRLAPARTRCAPAR